MAPPGKSFVHRLVHLLAALVTNFLSDVLQPGSRLQAAVKPMGSHLQAAPGAVLRHDADVGGVDTCADEPGQVVELDVSHLKK